MQLDASAPPLAGLRILEFAGIGPGPFAGMMLADMGAEIIRIERPGGSSPTAQGADELDFMARGRKSLALNLKAPGAVELALKLVETADGLIEGFRPGVMERLGLGPDVCRARNERLVFGRMTGWGQDGPISHTAGHDLNYIALTGALWASGEGDRAPTFPLNLLGDFGGGGMFLAFGMVTGMLKAARTGQGDVVDAAIVDGTAALMTMIYSRRAMGSWRDERATNILDGGAPWYGVYPCADGGWITIGSIEPQFWAVLLDKLGLQEGDLGARADRSTWPAMRAQFTEIFMAQPRDHWVALLQDTDACFAPVLSPAEAADHPHNRARGIFTGEGDMAQPMPAPRFATSQTPLPDKPPSPAAHSREILQGAGITDDEINRYFCAGTVS